MTAGPDIYDKFVLFSDLTAFSEIIVNFLTGRISEDCKTVILNPRKIALRYLRSDFCVDLIGALPLQVYIENILYLCDTNIDNLYDDNTYAADGLASRFNGVFLSKPL